MQIPSREYDHAKEMLDKFNTHYVCARSGKSEPGKYCIISNGVAISYNSLSHEEREYWGVDEAMRSVALAEKAYQETVKAFESGDAARIDDIHLRCATELEQNGQAEAQTLYDEAKNAIDAGDYTKAINYLRLAIDLGIESETEEDQEAKYWLGYCYEQSGKVEDLMKAVQVYREALEYRTIY